MPSKITGCFYDALSFHLRFLEKKPVRYSTQTPAARQLASGTYHFIARNNVRFSQLEALKKPTLHHSNENVEPVSQISFHLFPPSRYFAFIYVTNFVESFIDLSPPIGKSFRSLILLRRP